MKKIWFLLLVLFAITLFGCDKKIYHWEFKYEWEEICQIKIVERVDGFEWNEIKEIDLSLAQEVYKDITNIEMRRYGPNLRTPWGKSFMIIFNNGEYDIISKIEPTHFRYKDKKILGYNSWLRCNENEFNALIDKYLQSTD